VIASLQHPLQSHANHIKRIQTAHHAARAHLLAADSQPGNATHRNLEKAQVALGQATLLLAELASETLKGTKAELPAGLSDIEQLDISNWQYRGYAAAHYLLQREYSRHTNATDLSLVFAASGANLLDVFESDPAVRVTKYIANANILGKIVVDTLANTFLELPPDLKASSKRLCCSATDILSIHTYLDAADADFSKLVATNDIRTKSNILITSGQIDYKQIAGWQHSELAAKRALLSHGTQYLQKKFETQSLQFTSSTHSQIQSHLGMISQELMSRFHNNRNTLTELKSANIAFQRTTEALNLGAEVIKLNIFLRINLDAPIATHNPPRQEQASSAQSMN